MLKKRIIAVVTVKNGMVVQSFGYNKYLPIGRPEFVVDNLDRWSVDEIFLQCIDRSSSVYQPDFDLLQRVASLKLTTPLIYCGGIHTLEQAVRVIRSGADRIVVDQAIQISPKEVLSMMQVLGSQAMIASVPFVKDDDFYQYNYLTFKRQKLALYMDYISSVFDFSEYFLIDTKNEGYSSELNPEIISQLPFSSNSVILFGGLASPHIAQPLLNSEKISSIAIGNSFSHKEHAYQQFKLSINSTYLRPPSFTA